MYNFQILIDNYTWRGALLIEGGFILNGAVCGLVLIQPDENTKLEDSEINLRNDETLQTQNSLKMNVCTQRLKSEVNKLSEQQACIQHNLRSESNHFKGTWSSSMNDDTIIEIYRKISEENVDKISHYSKDEKRCLSLEPLKNVGFVLLVLSNMLIEFGLNTPFAFLPDMMIQRGYRSQDAIWIMFVIGI